jgi:uncharacterized membrane protein YidH (DUF202 family)
MKTFLFDRTSYLMLVGSVAIILVGYFLMQGGGSDDPAVYNPEMFNFQRLVVAPGLVLVGLLVALLAMLRKPKAQA